MFLAFKMCIVSRPVRLPVLWGRLGRVWAADPDAAEDLPGGGRGRGHAGVQGAAPGGHGAHVETGEADTATWSVVTNKERLKYWF